MNAVAKSLLAVSGMATLLVCAGKATISGAIGLCFVFLVCAGCAGAFDD